MNAPDTTGSPSGEPPVPTCFRHPGRETYLSCVRCGRPACPECLRDAPVGQQCVECVHGGNRATPAARTVFGGKMTSGPLVTWVLMGINVAVYLLELADRKIIDYFAMIGGSVLDPAISASHPIGVAAGDWYRLITAAFLHQAPSPLHILFNMWALYVVGPPLEQALGRLRFTVVYLASALGGSVLFYFAGAPNVASVGASGAIFGLFGAWFVVARRLRLDPRGIIVLIVLNLVISFTIPSIAWQAHVGGLVTGAALTAAYAYAPRNQRLLVQAGATAALVALLIIATMIRTQQLVA
ncbi:MAG: rhomboid family intramembrane serine protease [Micromonosporaceae bacterium]